jgi:hypothetical protein
MTTRKLKELFRLITDEANSNPEFAAKLGWVLGEDAALRTRGRRSPATLDPVAVHQSEAEHGLRVKLQGLSLDQLRDIVSEYGMDKSQLVMKWTKPARVIEHIVLTAATRARKGDAFR